MPGDGVVHEYKANINNYCTNCPSTGVTNNIFYYNSSAQFEIHTDLPEQNYQNMQGLDEPNELSYAYNIDFNTLITGMVTMQPTGGYPYDYDDYKFYLPVSGNVTVSISDIYHPDLRVRIYDGISTQSSYIQIGNTQSNNGSTTLNFTQNLSAGSYYLEIFAEPTVTTYYDSYKFYLNSTSTTDLGDGYYLELINVAADNSLASNWRASTDAVLSTNRFDSAAIDFTVYPNPVKEKMMISSQQTIQNVSVYNLLGQQINSVSVNYTTGEIKVPTLQKGMYILTVKLRDGAMVSKKFFKE